MCPVLLLASLAAPQTGGQLSSTANGTHELVIGVDPAKYGALYWNAMPQPDQELHTTVGTKLVFKYSSGHDVGLVGNDRDWLNCALEDFEELASTTQGGGAAVDSSATANRFAAVVTAVGEYYFVCSQPEHCRLGQKIKVVVKMGSPPPPAPLPHPRAPPMPPRRIWPSQAPPPPSNPPANPCFPGGNNENYFEEDYTCEDWMDKWCVDTVAEVLAGTSDDFELSATFDVQKLLLNSFIRLIFAQYYQIIGFFL